MILRLLTTTPVAPARRACAIFTLVTGLPVECVSLPPVRARAALADDPDGFDVYVDPDPAFLVDAARRGLLLPWGRAGLGLTPMGNDAAGFAAVGLSVLGICYSTATLDAPPTWADLITPVFAGKVAVKDPRATGQASSELRETLAAAFGESYLRRLAGQSVVVPDGRAAAEAVEAGVALAAPCMPLQAVLPFQAAGAAIAWTKPEPFTAAVLYLAVSACSHHPVQARALARFLLAAEGSHAWNSGPGDRSPLDPDISGWGRPVGGTAVPQAMVSSRRSEVPFEWLDVPGGGGSSLQDPS
ncbi:MAG: extracellular solute-binding protein [Pseudonocardia sp.]|uniref:extracellular solute-binding protein n=1 Tax=unclassified Pseudonocardia TaxID=2619320 RepID=UPI001AC94DDB|nr:MULTISPECIES: extracellular solute-binding protein [unclassified Pseudonocardia]MBN9108366.1 extracellular solute-binding protein [Pseudonocardia sp.]